MESNEFIQDVLSKHYLYKLHDMNYKMAIYEANLTKAEAQVYDFLHAAADNDGNVESTDGGMAKIGQMSRSTIQKGRQGLLEKGLLVWVHVGTKSMITRSVAGKLEEKNDRSKYKLECVVRLAIGTANDNKNQFEILGSIANVKSSIANGQNSISYKSEDLSHKKEESNIIADDTSMHRSDSSSSLTSTPTGVGKMTLNDYKELLTSRLDVSKLNSKAFSKAGKLNLPHNIFKGYLACRSNEDVYNGLETSIQALYDTFSCSGSLSTPEGLQKHTVVLQDGTELPITTEFPPADYKKLYCKNSCSLQYDLIIEMRNEDLMHKLGIENFYEPRSNSFINESGKESNFEFFGLKAA